MAQSLPPIPNNPITDTFVWRDWFFKVSQLLVQQASIAWTSLDFTGSNLLDIQTRQHNALQAVQGGNGAEEYHLTAAEHASVVALPTFGTMATQNANAVNITGGTITGVTGIGMTYPGAGIANSTGSAWGTSYTTTGSGTVLALASSPVFPTDITVNSATVGKGAANRDNLAVGNGALSNASTTGTSNIGLGKGTLTSLTSGGSNIAIGYYALPANQSGANNIAIGYSALSSNIVGSNNVAIGNVLLSSTTDNNVGMGSGLGGVTTSQTVGVGSNIANSCNATDSIFFGYAAASGLTASNNSVVIGSQALGAATGTVGAGSIAIGYQASYTNNTAIQTAIGYQACWSATARGNGCTAIGYQALYTNGIGTASTTLSAANTTVGYKSLYANTTGRFNTALGHQAGWGAAGTNANTTGFNNIYIGYQTIGSASTNSNETVIGASAVGLGSGTVVLGNTSVSLTQLRGVIYGTNYTVATLPTATVGARAFVTDALTPVFGTAVTGGGAVAVPVYADNAGVWMVG